MFDVYDFMEIYIGEFFLSLKEYAVFIYFSFCIEVKIGKILLASDLSSSVTQIVASVISL